MNNLDQQPGFIWMNGQFVPWTEAKIHVLTHTLHYGSGVFEGERAYQGRIFKMEEHHKRLHESANMLGFKIPYSVEQLNQAAQEILKLNELNDAYVRPIAWYGPESSKIASKGNSVNVAIAAWVWNSYYSPVEKGLKLMWADWVRPAPNMAPVRAKASGLYMICTIAKNKAENLSFDDALFLDYRGYVAECTSSNIFMVKNGVLYTPIPDCFLNGITRQTIIELAHQHQIPVEEKYILPAEILEADEIFVTGSAAEVQPVSQLDDRIFPIGEITQKMIGSYRELVNVEW